ncbi:hypothetical protein V3C99_013837 [Haemonchus contortus]
MSWVTVLFTVFIAYRVNSGGLPPLASSNTPRVVFLPYYCKALNWLVTAFIGLIADSVERSNSTEPYEESEVEWKPY